MPEFLSFFLQERERFSCVEIFKMSFLAAL